MCETDMYKMSQTDEDMCDTDMYKTDKIICKTRWDRYV